MTNRVSLVTGAAHGIGAAIAHAFADSGYTVVLADVNEAAGEEAARELQDAGYDARFISVDVSKPESISSLVRETEQSFGTLDVLINNAATNVEKSIEDLTLDEWDHVTNTNQRSAFLLAKLLLPLLKQSQAASIINISSVNSLQSLPNFTVYSASKAALNSLTQTLAIELGPHGIRVNAILPGFIWTNLWDRWLGDKTKEDRERILGEIKSFISLGRIGKPDDVASLALFLAGDAAAYITGSLMVIDGGLTARNYVLKNP